MVRIAPAFRVTVELWCEDRLLSSSITPASFMRMATWFLGAGGAGAFSSTGGRARCSHIIICGWVKEGRAAGEG